MPTRNSRGEWECKVCHKIYDRDINAITCEKSHDLVYVPFKRGDLFQLIEFLYTGDTTLLSKSLLQTLMKYRYQLKGDITSSDEEMPFM